MRRIPSRANRAYDLPGSNAGANLQRRANWLKRSPQVVGMLDCKDWFVGNQTHKGNVPRSRR